MMKCSATAECHADFSFRQSANQALLLVEDKLGGWNTETCCGCLGDFTTSRLLNWFLSMPLHCIVQRFAH